MPSDSPSILLLIPAYNEESRIGPVLGAYALYFREHHPDNFHLVVVLNGCTDDTLGVVERASEQFPEISHVNIPEPVGKVADVNAKDARGWTSLDYSIELNEAFGGFGDNDKIESIGITETITLYSRNEDGSENPVTVNNTKIKEIKEIADLLRKHGGKTGAELKAEGK